MKPTYEIENFQFFNADNMLIMKQYPDKYFNLAIIDPPYGIGQPKQSNLKGYDGRKSLEIRLQKNRLNQGSGKLKDRKLNTSNCDWDNAIPTEEYFNEIFRISENQIIWGGNYFPLPPTRCVLCWDKVQPWENFSQIELAWTSFDSPAQIYKFDNRTGDKIHPTQKPIALYEWILNKYAKENDKIIDTHLGSGSIAIAIDKANQLDKKNLSFVGIELDTEYFNASIERFKNHKLQLNLFT
jgi:site-specific DNA-methyltransferase (adenine-specific)